MKLGIVYVAYDCPEYVEKSLENWLGQDDVYISAISQQFKFFPKIDNSETVKELEKYLVGSSNYNLIVSDDNSLREHEVRNKTLEFLFESKVDTVLILDSDEFYSKSEIDNLRLWINNIFLPSKAIWSKINLKNYTFSESSWTEGFCPPRIFKVKSGSATFNHFYLDNDGAYIVNDVAKSYKDFPFFEIPKEICFPKHLTWLSNARGKNKVEYQLKHFGGICSFKWQDNKLSFNEDYYKNTNQEVPKLNFD